MKPFFLPSACPLLALVVTLASCSSSARQGGAPETESGAASSPAAPGRQGTSSPSAAGAAVAGGGSLAEAVGQVEQSFSAAKAALIDEDIETLGKALATGRQRLARVNTLLGGAKLTPANLQGAKAAAAALAACCSQAEAAVRAGQEVASPQLAAFAKQLDGAIASLKASTAGAP